MSWMAPGAAQEAFPSKPIKIVVPVVGGTMDLMARLVAPKLTELWGQPVVVENRPGAGGNIATDLVAKAPPDGYTLLVGFNGPIAINVTLFDKLPYDPLKDLAPITLSGSSHQFLVVHPSVPVSSVAEFVAYVKARQGEVSYGSVGVGGASHLTMEMFKSAAGLDMVHVPYKGSAPVVNDMIAGVVKAAFLVPTNVLPYIKGGQMKVLASSGRTRLASTPNIPTLIESGYPDFEAIAWIGFLAPGATPKPIIERYHQEITRILKSPDVHAKLAAVELDVTASTPEEFAQFIRAEIPRWGKVVRQTGAKAN
jgi:tripartite-type tricarboxylate transporter receptor subunit TctC